MAEPATLFPAQPLNRDFVDNRVDKVIYATPDGLITFAPVRAIDVDARTIDLVWDEHAQGHGAIPGVVVADEWVSPSSKRTALTLLANQVVDPG